MKIHWKVPLTIREPDPLQWASRESTKHMPRGRRSAAETALQPLI